MKFRNENKIFDVISQLFVGIVVAKGIDDSKQYPLIEMRLAEAITTAQRRFEHIKVKEAEKIFPYREAFHKLGMNPNKIPRFRRSHIFAN